jgi:CheY-like chemotaxis protein
MNAEKLKIVVIEDDDFDHEILSDILKNSGVSYEETWLKDGEEGLRYIKKMNDNKLQVFFKTVFFIDIGLPKVDGLTLLREIKNQPATKESFSIILTTSNAKKDIETAKEYGSNLFLTKPFGKEELSRFENLVCSQLSYLISKA